MANTVSSLSYANTFGDWIVKTNALINENNNLAANSYTKDTGTLYLNEPVLGLSVYNNGFFGGQVESATLKVNNNAGVGGTLYANNSTLSLVTSTGQANIGGLLLAKGSGTGLSVVNNATVGGTLGVSGVTSLGTTNISGVTTLSNTLNANTGVNNLYTVNISGETNLSNNFFSTGSIKTSGGLVSDTVVANTSVTVPTVYGTTVYATNIQANTSIVSAKIVNSGNVTTDRLIANTRIDTPVLNVANQLINSSGATFKSLTIPADGTFTIDGAFVLSGTTSYTSTDFILNDGGVAQNAVYQVYRGSGNETAKLRWNESSKYWDLENVVNTAYYRILTNEYLSDSTTLNSSSNVATSAAVYTLNNSLSSTNTYLSGVITTANSVIYGSINNNANNIQTVFNQANAAFNKANTTVLSFIGTSGTATANNNYVSFLSSNGVTITGTSNTITINTPQDVRTTASPTFNALTLTTALPVSYGGTGATSTAQALTNLLPSGTTAGYVLTTGGAGSFYWAAAAAGGGGTTPGTTINSSRLSYSGDSSNVTFTTPTYTPGSSQLRVYIDGVRQFSDSYTEASNTTVRLNTAPTTGSAILVEVDGYINNPYYANNIAFTINSNISASANTIQLAIDGLTSKVTTYYANTSSTYSDPSWITGLSVSKLTGSASDPSWITSLAATKITGSTWANTSSTYSDPSWITSLAASKLTGTTANTTVGLGYNSSPQFASIGIGTLASEVSGEIRAANNITAFYTSDIKFKENVQSIDNALGIVDAIGGKTFDWNDDYINSRGGEDGYFVQKKDFGVIAQDVQSVFPLAVRQKQDGTLAVDYEKLCAIAFQAIKELKAEVDALKGN